MATRIEMHFVHARGCAMDGAFDAVADEIERVEQALSAHRVGAALHSLNLALAASTRAEVRDDILFDALDVALRLRGDSGGLFDPSVGARTLGDVEGSLGALGALPIALEAGVIACSRAGARFDLGGFGKGFALDRVRPVLAAYGVASGLISLGESSVLALGRHPHGAYWPLSLPDPFNRDAELICVGVEDLCWSVSSNLQERADGSVALNAHILNPRSGEAVTQPRTVLALHASGARAEALSTAMMAAAPEEREGLATRFADTPIAVFDHNEAGGERRLYNGMETWLI
jgi:thiamine biosynthesis lipoprotein